MNQGLTRISLIQDKLRFINTETNKHLPECLKQALPMSRRHPLIHLP